MFMEICEKNNAAQEIKIIFLYGADNPYSQDFAKQFVFF